MEGTPGLPLAAFLLGLASGVHCVGMCGGIVAAFSAPNVVRGPRDAPKVPSIGLLALFNTGRVSAYTLAGAAAGALGAAGALAVADFQVVLYVLANVLLVLIGLHLAGISPLLARLEAVGAPLWRRIQPLAARFLPANTPLRAVVAGSLWGWLPCGLVYGMLATAVAAGGVALARLQRYATKPAMRLGVVGLVLAFGVVGLARAADLGEVVRRGLLCL